MATWYRTTRYSTDVTPVEVVNATEKSLTIRDSEGHTYRRAKSNEIAHYFPTKREALLYQRNRLRSSIETMIARTQKEQQELRAIDLQLDGLGNGQVTG